MPSLFKKKNLMGKIDQLIITTFNGYFWKTQGYNYWKIFM